MNNTLPDDIEQLKALLIAQQAVIVRLSGEITGYAREISSLRALVAKLQRMLFGRSNEKSREKIEKKIARAETRITELQNRLGVAQLQLTSMAGETAPKTSDSPVRKALPATLPRDRQVISPAETECPVCSGKLKPLGESISEQLDIINTAFRVIETVRPKLACSRCDCIVQAPQPPKPIERSYASPALLARIIMAKFAEHLPLYRQSEIYARQGVELHRNTMGRWVDIMGEQLRPLYDELKHYVLMPGKVHADDTPVNVLEPGQGKTRTGRLWVYVRDDRNAGSTMPAAVWFAYSPDRKGIHPQNHLASYSGVFQAGAYGGYRVLYESGRITEAACMAHARRKIHDVHARVPTDITTEALQRIGELYVIEAEVRGCSAEQHLAARKARAAPLMQSLYDWIQTQMKTLSRHSDTAKAFAYLLKQWEALNVYCSNGWVEIDNNIAENTLLGVAVGRKNWLFAGSDSGGEHAAVLYSLIGTCRLNNVEPEKWLRYVIEHIQDWPANRVRDLLPWKVDLTSQ
ncbi:IS66 family transposase [Escherichia coli]|uniref:IS66 family transposase n=4 Tax=Escherichia coli TaxID=562 RepID=UPI000BB69EEC|nr:IS66 family transposase [Escherichia coli]